MSPKRRYKNIIAYKKIKKQYIKKCEQRTFQSSQPDWIMGNISIENHRLRTENILKNIK